MDYIVNKLILESFEMGYILDDLLESLDDFGLLNEKGKEVRGLAYGKVYKGTETENDRFKKSWGTFNESTKKYLIDNIKDLNPKAQEFIKSQVNKS